MTEHVPPYVRLRPRRQHWWLWVVIGALGLGLIMSAATTPPREGMSQERLDSLARQLKCLQCAGENAADSRTSIAVKFREEISTQMAAGQTDDEILNFFVARYGPEVLLSPPSSGLGVILWLLPVVLVAVSIFGLSMTFMRWRNERVVHEASVEDSALVADARRSRSEERGEDDHSA